MYTNVYRKRFQKNLWDENRCPRVEFLVGKSLFLAHSHGFTLSLHQRSVIKNKSDSESANVTFGQPGKYARPICHGLALIPFRKSSDHGDAYTWALRTDQLSLLANESFDSKTLTKITWIFWISWIFPLAFIRSTPDHCSAYNLITPRIRINSSSRLYTLTCILKNNTPFEQWEL